MSSLTIVASFGAMLFLPCAVALFGMKEGSEPEAETAVDVLRSNVPAKKVTSKNMKAAETAAPVVVVEKHPSSPAVKSAQAKAEPAKTEQPKIEQTVPAQTIETQAMPAAGLGSVEAARATVAAQHPQGTMMSGPETALRVHEQRIEHRVEHRVERWDPMVQDPVVSRRGMSSHQARVERTEIEALKARALAVRAHAEALAAVARAATAKAEAAQYEAAELEVTASMMKQDASRRAA